MAAPYFDNVIVGNVGSTLRDLGYSDAAMREIADRLADEWMRRMAEDPRRDPNRMVVGCGLSTAADGSSIETLNLVFRLMPRSNGEIAGWLLEETPEEAAARNAAQVPEEKSPLQWSVSFSVVNAVWEDGTAGQGYVIFTDETADLADQAAFDDPRKALEYLGEYVLRRLGRADSSKE